MVTVSKSMVKTSKLALQANTRANGTEMPSMVTVTVSTKLAVNTEVTLTRMNSMAMVNLNGRELRLKMLIILIKVNGTKVKWRVKVNSFILQVTSPDLFSKTTCAIIKTSFTSVHSLR